MSSTNTSSLINTLIIVQRYITLVFSLIFIMFGITGTFLNILLFSRRQFRRVSCCIYFLASSTAMFALISLYSLTSVYAFYYRHPISYLFAFCKSFFYLNQLFAMMFRWNLAAACFDRYTMSSINTRFRAFGTVRIAYRVVTLTVFISIVFPVYILIMYGLRGSNCVNLYSYPALLYTAIFTIINTTVCPGLIMLICTFLIRRNLAKKRERRQVILGQQTKINDREHLQRKRDQQTLVMLFAQIILYIILTTPYATYTIYDAISLSVQNKSSERIAIEQFIFNLCGVITMMFPTLSFYLYTLTSSMFRKEFFNMSRSFFHCNCFKNNNRIDVKP